MKGFTLIEALVVIAIVIFMAGTGLFLSMDVYRASLFNSDSETLAYSLIRARSQAINNIDEAPHGVKISGGNYIIFQGNDYASRDTSKDEIISGNSSSTITGPNEIVFSRLSGNAAYTGGDTITITNGSKTTTINLNNEGLIDY